MSKKIKTGTRKRRSSSTGKRIGSCARRTCSAFVMDRMPWEKDWTIRIVIPGIDEGGAVYLEATSKLKNRKSAEDLLDLIMEELPNIKRD